MTTNATAPASFADMLGTLTGFDEIAIAQKFGAKIEGLGKMDTVRAVAFIDRRRNHAQNDTDAYMHVMNLTLSDLKEYFPEAEKDAPEADALGEAPGA